MSTTTTAAQWLTISVTAVTGWSNVFRTTGGERAYESPALILQQSPDGRRRTVFAAITTTGELAAAPEIDGYKRTVTTESWELGTGGVTGW